MERLSSLSPVKQQLLEQRVKGAPSARVTGPEIPTRAHRDSAPLSFAQQQMWLIDRMTPGNPAYNLPIGYRLLGSLDLSALERSFNAVIARHEGLRTTFAVKDGEPVQLIHPELTIKITVTELDHLTPAERESRLQILASEESVAPFDLSVLPLIRVSLFKLDAIEHVLFVNVHHIVADGLSTGVLLDELDAFYRAFTGGAAARPPDLAVQCADFALWQRRTMASGAVHASQIEFWQKQLGGDLPVLQLPADRPRPPLQSFKGSDVFFNIPAALVQDLRLLSAREGCTFFVALLSAFQVLLHRYSGADDFVIGTPVAMRSPRELEPLIGNLLNMVALRCDLSGDPTFIEFLQRNRDTTLEAFSNSDVPFEVVLQHLKVERDPSRNPVFQVVMQVLDTHAPRLGDLEISSFHFDLKVAPFDLTLLLYQKGGGYLGWFAYCTDLFDAQTIGRLCGHYEVLLQAIARDPHQHISRLPLLTEAERHELLVERNATKTDYPASALIHELYEVQASRTPDAVAVVYEGRQLTYAQLNARANQLAHYLARHGVGPETMVGICLERSLDMVVGVLGILKAGGAYVPLDPDYPASRLKFMLDDTAAPVLLTQARLSDRFAGYTGRLIPLDAEWPEIAAESHDDPNVPLNSRNLAYVVYTSGSTGQPKGTCIEHRSVVRLVTSTNYAVLGPQEIFLQYAPLSFDASTFELWGCLLNGGKLVVCPAGVLSLHELGRIIQERGVTTLWLTAALFHQMVDEQIESLRGVRQLLAGGETLSVSHVRRMLDVIGKGRLINGYGPTENTTFTCCHVMTADSRIGQTVPIGRPISNTQVYILDRHLQPVPVGVYGELFIGGDGLTREYLHQPELTSEKFVPNPFSSEVGARLYRSGDRVRFRTDGSLEFLCRIDNQVKIHGFRIELGEIEAMLDRCPGVRESVVSVRENEPGQTQLLAYVRTHDHDSPTPAALRTHLKERLPHYMIPSAFVLMESFPLTPNGKIDRKALPAPKGERQIEQTLIAPRNELEQRIAKLWCEMLQLEKVGVTDNFFDLGGHSLLLVKTCARLRSELHCELKVVDLFACPTIETLVNHLDARSGRSLLAEDTLARVNRCRSGSTQHEPIAIVGMAGRFPGARDIESFWSNLCEGKESIAFFSVSEMREDGVPDAILNDQNYVGARGYLEEADKFDAAFFGYSAREAEIIDPQQRVLLECAAETLERAGYDPDRYDGVVGVYAGSSNNTYLPSVQAHDRLSAGDLLAVLGSRQDFLTTRVSYKLNLRGPSLTIQTACSTSLVAVHQACQALWHYECDMALAGGVSVTVPMRSGHLYVQDGIGSPDGHCRAFDAGANGTVGGSGVAMVLLKRLSEALADGDHVHAVIRGTAINNDGSSKVGYTAPSVEGQARAIALAQAAAQCDPDTIEYVETHGTGTLLGDPIEISALTRVFGDGRRRSSPCWLGSLKTNVGHLDAAAGIAGLIKAALSLEHKKLAPSLNFSSPNPQIDFGAGPFTVNTRLRPWERLGGAPRRAGVSSFGLGGTNAHAVLEEPPAREPSGPSRAWQLLCLSAKTPAALDKATTNLASYLREHPDINLADAAYTLQIGRREFPQRRVVVCRDAAEAASALESGAAEWVKSSFHDAGRRSVVFMFSGQGAQYPDMGRGLYQTESVFRQSIDQCCETLKEHLDMDLRDVLWSADAAYEGAVERLKHTEVTQPALFVVEYALARLWMSLGVHPTAMIGHSVGEYVAACLAGVMSLDEALRVVAERGRLMKQLPQGSMLSVPLSEAHVLPLLSAQLSLASINGPSLCVVSGPEAEIAALEARLIEMELSPRRLHTSHAFHSFLMDPILEPFTNRMSRIALKPPQLPYISNVTGEWITTEQATDAAYYASHLRQPVQFAKGLEQLFADPNCVFLEVGPGHTLTALAKRHPAHKGEHAFVASMRHADESRPDEAVLMDSVGQLWLAGVRPDWSALHAGHRPRRMHLPTYPFERKRYWIESSPHLSGPKRIRRRTDSGEWMYVPSWRRTPAPSAGLDEPGANWLLFVDEHGLGSQVEADLIRAGARVAAVAVGERFGIAGPGKYTLNPAAPDDYGRLVAHLRTVSFTPQVIVHFWSVSRDEELREDSEFLAESEDRGFFSLAFLMQALEAGGLNGSLRLAAVTAHTQNVSGHDVPCPEKAMALGPCKVIGMEHPHILTRSIDVTVDGDLQWLSRVLISDLCARWTEPVVAYRGRYRWVQAYEQIRSEPPAGRPAVLRDGAVYLITGGLGVVGLGVAQYLARMAQAKIVLVSRTALPAREQWAKWLATHHEGDSTSRKIRCVEAMEAAGAEVLVCRADVADERQMAAAIAEAEARFGPLCGVMHAAGATLRDVPIATLRRSDCDEQFRPRQQGLRVLAKLLRGRSLDFCIVHSSLASVMGVLGSVSYTAAHLFMDAFVHRQNRNGATRWRTINWDHWMRPGAESRSPAAMEFSMMPQEVTDVLSRLLSMTDEDQVLVSTGDLQGRIDQWIRRETLPVVKGSAEHLRTSSGHPRPKLSSKYEAPRTDTERLLANIWCEMFGIDQVSIHDNFFELGGDSVLNIQITAKANEAGLKITPQQAFQHQTIAALAAVAVRVQPIVSEPNNTEGPKAEAVDDIVAGFTGPGISDSDLAEIGRQLGMQVAR